MNKIWKRIWNRLRDPFYNKEWAARREGLERRHSEAMDCLTEAMRALDRGDMAGMDRAYEEFEEAVTRFDEYAGQLRKRLR